MSDISWEEYQDLVRKLSLANERVRDREDRIAELERWFSQLRDECDLLLDVRAELLTLLEKAFTFIKERHDLDLAGDYELFAEVRNALGLGDTP